jgi:hypothetical protein
MVSPRCLLGFFTLAAIVIVTAETRAEDISGWTRMGKAIVDLTPFKFSLLNLEGDSGLQLAVVSRGIKLGAAQRFSVGVGYDDMVASRQHGEVPQASPITEQLFLFQTSCDKRFQLTLQFRW